MIDAGLLAKHAVARELKLQPWVKTPLTLSGLRDYRGTRALALLDNSITTDHINPIGSIKAPLPAAVYPEQHGVTLTLRLNTQAEIEYVKRGGILPYVLEGMAA